MSSSQMPVYALSETFSYHINLGVAVYPCVSVVIWLLHFLQIMNVTVHFVHLQTDSFGEELRKSRDYILLYAEVVSKVFERTL